MSTIVVFLCFNPLSTDIDYFVISSFSIGICAARFKIKTVKNKISPKYVYLYMWRLKAHK